MLPKLVLLLVAMSMLATTVHSRRGFYILYCTLIVVGLIKILLLQVPVGVAAATLEPAEEDPQICFRCWMF